jgi:hypothetical protein
MRASCKFLAHTGRCVAAAQVEVPASIAIPCPPFAVTEEGLCSHILTCYENRRYTLDKEKLPPY